MTEKKENAPGRPARACAWILGLLMTLMLFLTAELLLGQHMLLSGGIWNAVTGDGGVVTAQMEGIRVKVSALAEEKGFDADNVMKVITEDSLRSMNHSAGAWMREAITTGRLDESPAYPAEEIQAALKADEGFVSSLNSYMAAQEISSVTTGIRNIVEEKSMQFREVLLRAAVKTLGEKISLQALSAALMKLPLITALVCLVLAGLMALVLARRMVLVLRYAGAALMAAGILLALCLTALLPLGIWPMLKSISDMLAREYYLLNLILAGETLLTALAAGGLGYLAMRKAGRAERKLTE